MKNLLDSPLPKKWVNNAIKRHEGSIFCKISPAIIWIDENTTNSEHLTAVDPIELVSFINNNPYPLLLGHDPGKPVGLVIESSYFENKDGTKFIAAVLGYYEESKIESLIELDINLASNVEIPKSLPDLPKNFTVEFAADPRDIDPEWLDTILNNSSIAVKHTKLSHNSADQLYELFRIGLPYAAIVWVPFITSFATEAGKDAYYKTRDWLNNILQRSKESTITCVHSNYKNCQLTFIFRGKNCSGAQEKIAETAIKASKLIDTLEEKGKFARELVHEFDKEEQQWHPAFIMLQDGKIISYRFKLTPHENTPKNLSLGVSKNSDQ